MKNNNILFYSLVGVVALVLSTWLISVSSYKNDEITILQGQIDSLITFANLTHKNDTTLILNEYLPSKTFNEEKGIKHIIFVHGFIFIVIISFLLIYVVWIKNYKEKKRCFSIKKERK